MSPNAPACRSFVFFSLILCAMLYAFPLVHGITVDDEPDNANVNWHGEWFQYYNITSAMDETLTLGNRSKDRVTFTFTGELEATTHTMAWWCYASRAGSLTILLRLMSPLLARRNIHPGLRRVKACRNMGHSLAVHHRRWRPNSFHSSIGGVYAHLWGGIL